MTDLRDRFQALEDLGAPDLWHEIEGRARAASPRGARALPWAAIIVTLLLALALGGAAVIGSGVIKLPALVEASPTPSATARSSLPVRDLSATRLAYGLDGDIYLAEWDGRNPIRIADGVAGDGGPNVCGSFWGEGPMWSPDGRYLAYRSAWDAACASGGVYLSDSQGHVVASFPGTGWLVSWSPDSTRVAAWVDLSKTIGIYGRDGVRQALLTVPDGCPLPGDFDPVWSPDGRSLVIWPCEVPVDGRTPHTLPGDDPRSHQQWAYSPDGARVAYVTGESLVVAATDGSQSRVLVPTGVTETWRGLVWSPTGDRVAFEAGPSLSAPDEIGTVDVASGKVTSLASARGTGSVHVVKFSPDGDRILFARLDANYVGTSLWSVRTDGSDARLLVTGTGWGDW